MLPFHRNFYQKRTLILFLACGFMCLSLSYLLFGDFLLKRWHAGQTYMKYVFILIHLASIYLYIHLLHLPLRWLLPGVTYGFLLSLDATYYQINFIPPSAVDYDIWFVSRNNINDAMQLYSNQILIAVLKVTLIGFAIRLTTDYLRKLAQKEDYAFLESGKLLAGLLVFHFTFFIIAAYEKGPENTAGMAPGIGGPESLIVSHLASALKESYAPLPVETNLSEHNFPTNIIFVIDESVNLATFEDLWNKRDWTDPSIWYYPAYSSANCSAASNFLLRYNILNPQLAERYKSRMSLLEKAKKAGYNVIYYDMQHITKTSDGMPKSLPGNYFQPHELMAIDKIIVKPENLSYPDLWVVEDIERNYQSGKNFIFVNKAGAHFPYGDRTLEKDRLPNESEYQAAIRINSVEFLRKLHSVVNKRSNTAVFYTSDHGQNYGANSTHCSSSSFAPQVEWEVPLVFMGQHLKGRMVDSTHNIKLSHFHLTETLNNVLGYDDPAGPSVSDLKIGHDFDTHFHRALYGSPFPIFGRQVQTRSFLRGVPVD
jgi:glucan phosphoethanolaminetransferase (alkaline phosphatase superfamily)